MTVAVVLLSGGLDSTVTAALARRRYPSTHGLTISYGQSHAMEVEAAARVADALQLASWQHITLAPDLLAGGSITGSAAMPDATYEDLAASVGPSPTYVPFRNGTFLSLAAAYTLQRLEQLTGHDAGTVAGEVWAGMHAEDARGWAYPDCTPEFIGAMANAIYVGTYQRVRLVAPLQNMTKTEVVRQGLEVSAPMHLTRSCYSTQPTPCGTCPACRGRAHAFAEVGVPDRAQ